jgi:hypothetical protein
MADIAMAGPTSTSNKRFIGRLPRPGRRLRPVPGYSYTAGLVRHTNDGEPVDDDADEMSTTGTLLALRASTQNPCATPLSARYHRTRPTSS